MQRTTKAQLTPEQVAAEHGMDLGHELIDGFAGRMIAHEAAKLARTQLLRAHDAEDIEQELRIELMGAINSFDPAISHWNAFATTVIQRHVATMIDSAQTESRQTDREVSSLSATSIDEDGNAVPLHHLVRSEENFSARGNVQLTAEQRLSLQEEIENALAKLPDELRELAEQLQTKTFSEIARDSGIPRTTLYRRFERLQKAYHPAADLEISILLRQLALKSGR